MKILVVDDEAALREVLLASLVRRGHDTDGAGGMKAALAALRESEFDLVLLDIRLGEDDGIALLRRIREEWPQLLVIMMTAFGRIDQAVETLQNGAFDFLEKPFSLSILDIRIEKAERHISLRRANGFLREEIDRHQGDLEGNSSVMVEIRERIEKFSQVDMPILITGESGSGKEVAARILVEKSLRRDCPFVTVNCGAIPEALMESMFFGHEKGAFTGAHVLQKGKFELADGGTLFLDEIGELPLPLQVKLLRVLEEAKFERIGGEKSISANVRIISATNRDLEHMISNGQFRRDLYYRLNVLAIRMPPLRERVEDLGFLMNNILEKLGHELHRKLVAEPSLLSALARYSWPGNARELRNVLERMAVLSENGVLLTEDLPFNIYCNGFEDEGHPKGGLREELRSEERKRIQEALERARGNQSLAARYLGMKRTSLQYRIQKLHLPGPGGKGRRA